uniref:Transmembrane protein 161A n=1 Tax=Denticeps clupeoides TaxID=299321 RepID=A0AAY4EE75_9TELE
MGVQLVVSLLAASIMQRMAPHCSFARWLLCNGSLFRFKHPSEGELCALAGKQIPKTNRRDRRQNGNGENKPLTVPKDIDLNLESAPVTVLDALVLRFFVEYQWLVDFAVYAAGVYIFTEGYYSVVDASKEVNIGAIWCVLTVFFCLYPFWLQVHTVHYFRSDEGGERSVCLAFGFLSLLVAMLVLVVREDYLEFGLEPGFNSLFDNLEVFAKQQGYEWVPVTKLTVKLGLAAICAFIGALLAFPGLRLAQTHLDAVKMNAGRPVIQVLLHISFLSPLVILILWVKPIARDFLANAPMGKTTITLIPSSTFNSVRLWVVVGLCFLRLLLTRFHLQAYLHLAPKWVEQMKKEAGRIAAIDIQRKVTRVFCYLTVVTMQYVIPVLLVLFSTLAMKSLGDYSWGIGQETPGVTPAAVLPTAAPPVVKFEEDEDAEDMEEDIQATAAHLAEVFTTLRAVLTPLFFRGLFAFFTWWVAACQVISSLFGIYFHQYLMQN